MVIIHFLEVVCTSYKKPQTNRYGVILQAIRIIAIKKEKRVVTYTSRYSIGHSIQSCQEELETKYPLDYLQV